MEKEIDKHLKVIEENAIDVISKEDIIDKLKISFKDNRPLRLKIGFDPTARDIHLGHTVLLRKLRKLQDLGHQVYFIIGDFTAKIGDPSQRSAQRPILSDKEIKANANTYTKQAFRVLDKKKTTIIYNSIWYKKMDLPKFLSLLSCYTVARILERDDFSKRIKENRPLSLLEVVYPLVQGYDSYKMQADIEFGGTDQKFNLIVGRHIQQAFGQSSQAVVTMPILVGLDGSNKMSKSLDNYIGITDTPKDMFGKVMSISDDSMWEYFKLLSDFDIIEAKKLHPKEAKLNLAEYLVSFYSSVRIANNQRQEFERIFSKGKLPKDLPVYRAKGDVIDVIEVLHSAKLVGSKNEARRLLRQGGISSTLPNVSTEVFTPIDRQEIEIPDQGLVIKAGKKRFIKITR